MDDKWGWKGGNKLGATGKYELLILLWKFHNSYKKPVAPNLAQIDSHI